MTPKTQHALTFLQDYFAQQGYSIHPNHHFPEADWTVDVYAYRVSRTLGVLKYGDHLFLHNFDAYHDDDERLETVHQKARQVVNRIVKTPKALRITVPNITTLAVSGLGFSDYVKGYVRNAKHSVAAADGEIHAMYLLDVPERHLYSQGLAYTYIMGDARVIFGDEKAFAHNPANRMYATVQAATAALFDGMGRL